MPVRCRAIAPSSHVRVSVSGLRRFRRAQDRPANIHIRVELPSAPTLVIGELTASPSIIRHKVLDHATVPSPCSVHTTPCTQCLANLDPHGSFSPLPGPQPWPALAQCPCVRFQLLPRKRRLAPEPPTQRPVNLVAHARTTNPSATAGAAAFSPTC